MQDNLYLRLILLAAEFKWAAENYAKGRHKKLVLHILLEAQGHLEQLIKEVRHS